MLLIGLGNKARSGKDCAASAAVDYYQNQRDTAKKHDRISLAPVAQTFRFAEALYEECRQNHGMTDKDAKLLQQVGTEYRDKDPLHWIKKCFEKIDTSAVEIALISDVRYLNEAAFIKYRGGYLINVVRLNSDGSQFIATDRPADHPSEIELDGYNWDFRISAPSGHAGLVGELAATLVEYVRSLEADIKKVAW
jgi:hypothetical protein